MKAITWKTEKRKLQDLILSEYNPREAGEKETKDLAKSLSKFNLAAPLVINKNNHVIGGHFRLKILRERGVIDVDVRVPNRELIQKEERELNLRLNKNLGQWDINMLANFDEDVLKDVGFTSEELDKIFQLDMEKDPDNVPPVKPEDEVGVKVGELYQLGTHRLLCGDSTEAEAVNRLMAGMKADMVFTDPPYGVDYENKTKSIVNQRKDGLGIQADNQGKDVLKDVVFKAFQNIAEYLKLGGVYYICSPQGGELGLMMMMMDAGIECRHMIVWAKDSPVFSMGRLDYDYQHEPILYGWRGSHQHYGQGQYKTSLWQIPRPRKSKLHPTMKPVELIENAISNSSKREDVVLDLFGGSGSTLIACERLNRKCYMMEIDPIYCQVIIDRWEAYTNGKAKKSN